VRVLHIEDDAAISRSIELILRANGFRSEATDLGEEGIDLAKRFDFDAVICDGHLPDMAGVDVVRALRRAKIPTPVLMFTGDSGVREKVLAFSAGADDYLTKPAHQDEIIARLHALIRRSKGVASTEIVVGPIALDVPGKIVRVEGRAIHLTVREYQMLELLAVSAERLVTKSGFLDHIYGGLDEPGLKIIDVYICKLRKRLEAASPGAGRMLETIWGRGYRLTAKPIERAPKPAPTLYAGLSDRLSAALKRGPSDVTNLCQSTGAPMTSVRGALSRLQAAGRVENLARKPKPGIYRLTDRGAA